MPKEQGPIKILLVDDDEVDIMAFERALHKTGIDCILVAEGTAEGGLQQLVSDSFDVIFLDYLLPGTNGIQLLKTIRARGIFTPVAVLTSQGDEKIAVEMMKSGAFDYFPKAEVSPEKLNSVLRHILVVGEIEAAKIQAETALRENERLLDIVFNATHVGICLTNVQGLFVRVNQAFSDILGWQIDELLGNHFSLIFKEEFREAARELHQLFIAQAKGVVPDEWVMKRKDGQKIVLSVTNSLYTDDSNQKFVVTVLSDISDKKKTEEELIEAKRAAEQAAKAKTDFLSNMSHEIRTPMNAVIGLTELLLQEPQSEKNLEYLRSIKYSADNLLIIINDILDFSKIESGKITLENIDFEPRLVIDELIKTLQYKAREKGIELRQNIAEEVPAFLKGDPYRLNQILLNLAGNAIKFTAKGYVEIAMFSRGLNEEGKYQLIIEVKDTGIGIPEKKQQTIFESFTQAYTDTTRLFGGTGLGLAITQNLVMLQGGEIEVESEVGKGSTFRVSLSFAPGNEVKREMLHEQQGNIHGDQKDLKGMRILVVEDNKMNQFVARQLLNRWKAEVTVADNGEDALLLMEQDDYALVFMDLQMPVMGGFETTEIIRSGQRAARNQHVPIIALTADAFYETRQKVVNHGMNDFVTKPFDQEELYSKIVRYLPV
jgi:PAS domain S-box-containing protein